MTRTFIIKTPSNIKIVAKFSLIQKSIKYYSNFLRYHLLTTSDIFPKDCGTKNVDSVLGYPELTLFDSYTNYGHS